MNQQQLIEKAANEHYRGMNPYDPNEMERQDSLIEGFIAGASWMAGEGERLREQRDALQMEHNALKQHYEVLSRELSWAQEVVQPDLIGKIKDLEEALEELMSWQNGAPLPTYEKGWTAAMERAESLLAKPEPPKPQTEQL